MCRAIRESSGLRVAEVAKALDVAAQTVHNWERGSRTPRGALLEAYVAVLDALAEEQHPA
jgi:DNA-binding transcriptional regulator YiaG